VSNSGFTNLLLLLVPLFWIIKVIYLLQICQVKLAITFQVHHLIVANIVADRQVFTLRRANDQFDVLRALVGSLEE